jgi:hypothetical protein
MTFNIQVWQKLAGRVDGESVKRGSLEKPISISVTGNKFTKTETIANAANATMYADELGDFSYLRIVSDFNTRVVFTDTASATWNVQLLGTGRANEYGLPYQLGLDETSNSTTTINSVVAHNESGSTAKVDILIVE